MASGPAVLDCLNLISPPPPAHSHSHSHPSLPPPHTDTLLPRAFGPPDSAQEHSDQLSARRNEGGDLADVPDDQALATGVQRLQLHRSAMAGKVTIPDTWRWEQNLQDWVSCGHVEDALRSADLISAKNALVSECQRRDETIRTVRGASDCLNVSVDVEVS